jgi:molybdopterin-containing oxidoreductase family iron-sulfur binding subunit
MALNEHQPETQMTESTMQTGLTVEQVRQRLQGTEGPAHWRSLDELAQTEEFAELVQREFTHMLPLEESGFDRRRFLQLMGASLALAGLSGCSIQPDEHILPYNKQPEEIIPGKPLFFASAHPRQGFGRGVLVESHMGRPTKIEGNPDHPSSLGGSDLFDQASILGLYDPSRAQTVHYLGSPRSWEAFVAALSTQLTAQDGLQGAGLRILMENTTSPTIAVLLGRIRERFPKAGIHHWSADGTDNARAGARLAFGAPAHVHYDLSKADVVVTLDADLLTEGPGAVRYARDFAAKRRVVEDDHHMNRLYSVESTPTNTGTLADHRFPMAPARVEAFAKALATALGVDTRGGGEESLARTIANDLQAHRGTSLVVAGDHCPPEMHALALAMNERLGNLGQTVLVSDPVMAVEESGAGSIGALTRDLDAGNVDVLVVLGGNPVYDAPADLDFANAIQKASHRFRLGLGRDETSRWCQWEVPVSHWLETWGDIRAHDGSVSVVQPLIEPLYRTHSALEALAVIAGDEDSSGYELVRSTWLENEGASERAWRRWLHDGVADAGAPSRRMPSVDAGAVRRAAAQLGGASGLAVVLRPDPTIGAGEWANNGWLQECPKPHSRLTWDNAALVSPRTAESLGVSNEEMIRIEAGGRSVEIAAWILPTQADDTITLHLGYGRTHAGPVGNGNGFDVNPLRASDALMRVDGATVTPLGRRYRLATTQLHSNMEGRELVRTATFDHLHDDHGGHHDEGHHLDPNASLMPGFEYNGYKWGMTIDLSSCTGCNACVVACHSENNIGIVGKNEVLNGRELHWMRIDRYFAGDLDQPDTYLQPVMCQHCEQAPCEVVCPVAATMHTDEGLNTMAYNRCVGTRYCGNNCPYKVRRFNFYHYSDEDTATYKLMRNPDVTVRHRGVMEKCSYCIQRINHAKIEASVKDLPLSQTGLMSACQQACPTTAIEFGDLNDPEAKVAEWQNSDLAYGILTELGTRPRTMYLKRVSNPNPELVRS